MARPAHEDADSRLSAAAALLRGAVPDFRVVSATRVSESNSVVLRLSATDVSAAVCRLRERFPLWTCASTTSHAHGHDLVHILLPDGESSRRAAGDRARSSPASTRLRRLALGLLLAAVLLPAVQLALAVWAGRAATGDTCSDASDLGRVEGVDSAECDV